MKNSSLTLLCAAILAAPLGAGAATLIDTLGTIDSPEQDVTWIVGNAGDGSKYSPFAAFVSSTSGWLTDAVVSLRYVQGTVGSVSFELRADQNGRPGPLLGAAPGSFTVQGGLTGANFQGGTAVVQGGTYWFGISTLVADTQLGWTLNPLDVQGGIAFNGEVQAPDEWHLQQATQGAFQLNAVSAVPDAAPWALMLVGLGGIVIQRRRLTARR